MKLHKQLQSQLGLSLIELMISITLGLILLTGVMQVFLSSKNVYISQQALSRVQETGRLAIDFMARDIRMAGYTGCASRLIGMAVTNTLKDKTNYDYNFEEAIRGYKAPITVATLSPVARTGTDLVVIRGAVGSGVQVIKNNSGSQLFASLISEEANACPNGTDTRYSGLCDGDILMVADCAKARVFQAANVQKAASEVNMTHPTSGTPGNDDNNWDPSGSDADKFGTDSEILKASTITYYLASGAADTAGTAIPSLWKKENGVTTELLEGVEQMSITYGEDTSTDPDFLPDEYRYAVSEAGSVAVANWERVGSVRIELVVATLANNTVPETQKYYFKGATKTPTDLRLRQVFTTTIGIRSRSY